MELVQEVLGGSGVHALAWAASGEGGGRSQQSVQDLEGENIVGSPRDGLEGEGQGDFVGLTGDSGLTSDIFSSFSGLDLTLDGGDEGELGVDEVDELGVVLDTGGTDEDSVGVDVFQLELLEGSGGQVLVVVLEAVEGETQASETVGGVQEVVVDVSAVVLVQVVGVGVLFDADGGSDCGSGLEGTVGHHVEDVDDVVGQAVGLEVGVFLVVFHLEVTSRHLDHSVVDGFVCVEDGFIEGVFDGEERSGSFVGFISDTDVEKDSQIDDVGEDGRFGDDSDAIFKFSNFVFSFGVFNELGSEAF